MINSKILLALTVKLLSAIIAHFIRVIIFAAFVGPNLNKGEPDALVLTEVKLW
jgi:hypothetical protein